MPNLGAGLTGVCVPGTSHVLKSDSNISFQQKVRQASDPAWWRWRV